MQEHPNLIVKRTFSKAWGLAAARVGIAYANREIIGLMNKTKPPYNVSALNQEAALTALANAQQYEEQLAVLIQQRSLLQEEMMKLPIVKKIYPSDANFLLVEVEQANELYRYLVEKKVIVRNRHSMVPNCIRFTVGTPQENRVLLNELKNIAIQYEESTIHRPGRHLDYRAGRRADRFVREVGILSQRVSIPRPHREGAGIRAGDGVNQDGLGTSSFPEETFWPVHNMILKAFENEGFGSPKCWSTAPFRTRTCLPGSRERALTHYMKGNYDLENSFVIGDRVTDVQLAKTWAAKSILLSDTEEPEATLPPPSGRDIPVP